MRFYTLDVVAVVLVVLILGACESDEIRPSETTSRVGERLEQVVVDHVKDGDSFRAIHNGHQIEVRLFGIDAPEKNQPHADASRQMAVRLLEMSSVTLVVKDRDRYQRIVAEAFVAGKTKSVNQQLVEQGAAWVYRQYTNSSALIAAEEMAKNGRHGLWALPESQRIAPWVLRKKNRK